MAKILKVNGILVEFQTLSELAKACGKSVGTFRKYEKSGIIPPANFRLPVEGFTEGHRIYSTWLVNKVSAIVKEQVVNGVKISFETKVAIQKLFKEETTLIQEQHESITKKQ